MKTRKLPLVITACVVLCVLAAIGLAVFRSWEAKMPMPMPLALTEVEFSADGGSTWEPVGTDHALRKQRGDVAIRGHFNFDIREGWIINFYLQHMQMEFLVNGTMVGSFAREFREIRPEWCADIWMNFRLPQISKEDLVELRFYSLHPSGVEMGAYEKVLNSMTMGDSFYMYQYISGKNIRDRYAGLTLMIIGIVLFGISWVALLMKSPLQRMMMYTALFAVGEGLFWLADAAEISHYVNHSIALFSTVRYVSRMLCIYALLATIAELAGDKVKSAVQAAAYTNGVLCIVYLVLNMANVVTFCEWEHIWYCTQVMLLLVGSICGLWEIIIAQKNLWISLRLLTLEIACGSIIYDLSTLVCGWNTEMLVSKWICGVLAAVQAAELLVHLPSSYAAIRQAEKLSEELHNSRIVLAASQIRTHFIFNVLNGISGLCKSDPEQADIELVRFSRYLRNNIDIMQEDRPIPFEKALEHMHNYVDLEQMRFGDRIILDENYEYVDFSIPSLVLQPLVENAIKHGLLPKAEGGIIRVSTSRRGGEVLIEIADDGIGFDPRQKVKKTSVGLSNVRFRIEKMINGRMQVKSAPDEGTTVRLWVPIGKEEDSFISSM